MTTQTMNTTLAVSQQIHHLYQRAGFGLSPQEWLKMAKWTRADALQHLFKSSSNTSLLKVPSSPLAEALANKNKLKKEDRNELQQEERKLVTQQNADWLKRMSNPQNDALLERMSLFWHGHFACESKIARLAIQQLNSIRHHALGNFRDLVLAIAKDPAMIRYLNNQQNRKDQPNVAGWPGGKTWVDNSTLMIRLQLAEALYKASEVGFRFKNEPEQSGPRKLKKLDADINWKPIYKLTEGINEEELYSILSDYLLPNSYKTDQNTLMPFVAYTSREELIQTLCIRLMSLPEYQLC